MNVYPVRSTLAVILAVGIWQSATPAFAVKFWKNGVTNGNWNTGNNWSATSSAGVDNGGVPVASEPVRIVHTDGTPRTVTLNTVTPSVGLVAVDLTGSGTGSDTLFINAGANLTAGALFAGGHNGVTTTNGRAIVSQSGGTVSMSAGGDLVVGHGTGSNGLYALTGGALNASQSEFIGLNGTGIFNHSGGTNTIAAGAIGYLVIGNAGGNGTYNLTNTGRLESNKSEYIGTGAGGVGNFHQTGGTNSVRGAANNLYIGDNGATGTYILSGTSELYVDGSTFVGNSGTGTLTIQQQSRVYISNALNINGTSNVNLNGGTLRFNSVTGLNRLNFTAGTVQIPGNRQIGTDSTIGTLFPADIIPAGKGLYLEQFNGAQEINTTLRVDGGSFDTGSSADTYIGQDSAGALRISNGGTVAGYAFHFGLADHESYAVVGSGATWDATVLNIGPLYEGSVDVQAGGNIDNTYIDLHEAGTINLMGGTLRTVEIYDLGGTFNFSSGTLSLPGDRTIGSDPTILKAFGGQPNLTSGKNLVVDNTATLLGSVIVDGGAFTVGQIANGQHLRLLRGTLNISNQAATVGTAGTFGSVLDLNDDMTVNVTLGITNSGLVTGDGDLGGTFVNAAAGELRAEPGKSLKLTGANNTNAGQINLLGGLLEYTQSLTNNTSGFISGNGAIKTSALTNNGTMNFSGLMNIAGDVTNSASAKIISSGGGPTTFFDDVTNNGEIRTTAGSFTVFFGGVSGAGTFTGTGTTNFEGDLKPGNSPASMQFGGDVTFGAAASLEIEIGGTTPGTQYDRVQVAGELTLGGTLDVTLINGFTPAAGQTFNILDWGSLSGAFATLDLPTLAGLAWNTSQLYTSGVLSLVTAIGLPGDYNQNGAVDAADYTLWRDHLGSATSLPNDDTAGVGPDDFDRWKTNFGNHSGTGALILPGTRDSGSASGNLVFVPEPTTSSQLLLLTSAFLAVRYRWSISRRTRSRYLEKLSPSSTDSLSPVASNCS